MKRLVAGIMLLSLALGLAGCDKSAKTVSEPGAKAGKIKVIATVYPVYEFTRQVGGDLVDVSLLVQPGVEPHDWEPATRDIIKLRSAALVLYHGAGLEPWLAKILTPANLGSAKAVEISYGIERLAGHAGGQEHGKSTGDDPHLWLDPLAAKIEVANVAAALEAADPANGPRYRENAARYQQQLDVVDQEYQTVVGGLTRKDVVTSHEAFGYLTHRYGLRQVGVMGLSPDAEPTPERMKEIIAFCREHEVTTIYFETLISPKLADTIAKETGAQTLVLNPIEGLTAAETAADEDYISLMRKNLRNLEQGLNKQ